MTHLPDISVSVTPHRAQRYDTAGDYDQFGKGWWVNISELPDWRFEFAILIHELVEMALTKHRGISWDTITKFDMDSGDTDPGSLPEAPYHKEHVFAEKIERLVAEELGVDLGEYNRILDSLE